MDLFRYRTIESALRDIQGGRFHFASREELNDPMEGFVSVYWQGDRPAWEGLFRNYICSYFNAIENYLLAQNENVLWERTLLVDIHKFDDVPMGKSLREIGDILLEDPEVQCISDVYGIHKYKCGSDELRLILQYIHRKVYKICLEHCRKNNLIPGEMVDAVLREPDIPDYSDFPFDRLEELEGERVRRIIAATAERVMNDTVELKMIQYSLQEEGFAYGMDIDKDAAKDEERKKKLKLARQHRNWMALMFDFPKMYINQLKNMIYPEAYFVCFSGKNNDSAMWGNYADHHRGVCLIYDAEDSSDSANAGYYRYGSYRSVGKKENGVFKTETKYKEDTEYHRLNPKKVEYNGEIIERNFFESFGRLTLPQIAYWLTGKDGQLSCYYDVFSNKDNTEEWRNKYWETFLAKNYRKLEAWSYEDEYRLYIENTFYEFTDDANENVKAGKLSRNMKYDIRLLKGVIFGIKTSEYDKAKIIKALSEKGIASDIRYYQAEYNEENQKIEIRKKAFWGKEK